MMPSQNTPSMNAWAVIVAAGKGERMLEATNGVSKQFLMWHGEPLYIASARVFAQCRRICGVAFVFPSNVLEQESVRAKKLMECLGLPCVCVEGGMRRQDSVCNGLRALPSDCNTVLVHDAARPFVSQKLVERVLDKLDDGAEGVIPAIPVVDTIKIIENEKVVSTPERKTLRAVQTPQGFVRSVLEKAYAKIDSEHGFVTDDASALEACSVAVDVVEGESGNLKITRPEDLSSLEKKYQKQTDDQMHVEWRTGYGYDVHAYCDPHEQNARPLRLGGVLVGGGFAVRAHSDGDVLLHALMDSILGCFGGGDIGQLFPDKDPSLDNVSSVSLFLKVMEKAQRQGFNIKHVDVTVIAQKPAVSPFRDDIRKNLACLLHLPERDVNVKATTEEHLGFTGSLQGLKAVSVVNGFLSVR